MINGEEDEPDSVGQSERIAMSASERGARDHNAARSAQGRADSRQPRPSVVVDQGTTGCHLRHRGRRVKGIAVDKLDTERRGKGCSYGRLATTAHTNDH